MEWSSKLMMMRVSLVYLFRFAMILSMTVSFVKPIDAQILDKQEVLDRFSFWQNRDWDWYKATIPFFESPDSDIDLTYYYRWEMMTARMVYGSVETGYISTEFTDRPWWSGIYGAISCAAGHHLYEYRWFKDARYFEDYARYWFRTKGAQPRNYSAWIADAIWQGYKVYLNKEFVVDLRNDLVSDYAGWESERWIETEGMFSWDGMHDGMETNINSRQTKDWFSGAPGYRATLNSYMWANANAIRSISLLMDDLSTASLFSRKADTIKRNFLQKCWDPNRSFFFQRYQNDEDGGIKANTLTYQSGQYAGSPHGRELYNFVPWYFKLPDVGYESAWQYLMDSTYFFAPFGPTTVEKNDPLFNIAKNCCAWSGNAWPFATAQTLKAMANVIKYYPQEYVNKNDYFKLLKIYAVTHRKDGKPYIAEANHPETGSWDGHDHAGHSEHYFHSAYIDEIITGLVGLEPREVDSIIVDPMIPEDWDYFALDDLLYHGRQVSIIWDRNGLRYGKGKGLMIFVDGQVVQSSPTVKRLTSPLKALKRTSKTLSVNYAVNNENQRFLKVKTSFPGIGENTPDKLIDGQYWYYTRTANQWSSNYSKNPSDWVVVDFGVERPVHTIKLYFVEDSVSSAPKSYQIAYCKDGKWQRVPAQSRSPEVPESNRANVISFEELSAAQVRVEFYPQKGRSVSISELEAWGTYMQSQIPDSLATASHKNEVRLHANRIASASFTSRFDRIDAIIDGSLSKSTRWTAYESPNPKDWIEIEYDSPQMFQEVYLYFYQDQRSILPPQNYTIQYWDGKKWNQVKCLERIPDNPVSGLNIGSFRGVKAQKWRVEMTHQDATSYSGLYEVVFR